MTSLIACGACSAASCLTNTACGCFGHFTKISNTLTRLAYTLIFFGVSLGSWAWSNWGADWYRKHFPASKLHINCRQEVCFGAMSVYRILGCLTIFYFFHAFSALISQWCPTQCRKATNRWQSSLWGFKLVSLFGSILVTFWLPNEIFQGWAWCALVGGTFFILVQLIILVEFAHSWTESWLEKYDQVTTHENRWWWGLFAAMGIFYLVSTGLTIVEFVLFSSQVGCEQNALFITGNILLIILGSGLSVHPQVQQTNRNSGLLQSGMVAMYTSYLIYSAFMSQPDSQCHQLTGAKESFSAVVGALLVFLSVCYSALRVSAKSDQLRFNPHRSQSPVLPVSKSRIDVDPISPNSDSDEPFNYTFFHICFALASCYITMLITNWSIVRQEPGEHEQEYLIDRSLGSFWVKVVSSWLAHLLYIWSVVAPVLLPNREWYV